MGNMAFDLFPVLAAFPWQEEYWFPPKRSTFVENVDYTYMFISWVSVFFTFAILAIMILFCIQYRRRKGVSHGKAPTHHNGLEIAWSVLPAFLLVYMFYNGFIGFMDMRTMPDQAYNIDVSGQKWSWQFSYANGKATIGGQVPEDVNWHDEKSIMAKVPQLHVPVDTDVVLTMSSKDVIHSFYIPAFRVKQDVVPGRYTKLWFHATEKGTYPVFCAEYCGQKHSEMYAEVVAESQEDFDKWFEKVSDLDILFPNPVDKGRFLYETRGCTQCHSIDGTTKPNGGPSFLGGWGKDVPIDGQAPVKMDENYVRESILNPMAKIHQGFGKIMPAGLITKDKEIDGIIAFIRDLNEKKAETK